MRYKIELTPQSDEDLLEIITFIAMDSISDAIKVNNEILDRIEALSRMPARYPAYTEDPDYRKMVVGSSFAVYYLIDEMHHIVKIARIYRTERNIGKV